MEALTSLLMSLSRESDSLPWSRGVLQRVLMLWKCSHQLPDCGLQNGETRISFLFNLASLGYSVTIFWSTEPHAKTPLRVSKLGPWLENHRTVFSHGERWHIFSRLQVDFCIVSKRRMWAGIGCTSGQHLSFHVTHSGAWHMQEGWK